MAELLIHTPTGCKALSFEGTPLLHDLLKQFPDAPSKSCGGTGKCGMCAVVAKGRFDREANADGKILSCQTHVCGNAEVWLPARQTMPHIETSTIKHSFPIEPLCGQYGVAVDIGTTTVVLELLSLSDGKTLSIVSCENPQRIVAADVIGRMEGALNGDLDVLCTLIHDCVDRLERKAFETAKLYNCKADHRIIAGNTTMLYLYDGRLPRSLAAAPFDADCLFGMKRGRDLLPACAGAFVGADIVCAILSSHMCEKTETSMLIDIGTNGEIALWHNNQLYCCATAAGPAFEGCGITCGVESIPGAIDRAHVKNNRIDLTTIESAPAIGICGSGLIDLVACLLETEQLDESGLLEETINLAENVFLTQEDIRQIQLAKGAISAGIQTLLKHAGLQAENISRLYIAGGFGSHIALGSAVKIGLIPAVWSDRAVVLGNASLAGAKQLLLNRSSYSEVTRIARKAQCLNLASDKFFGDCFIESMFFETI